MLDILHDDSLFCKIYIENSGKWIDGVLLYVDLEKNVADVFLSSRHFRALLSEGSKVIIKSIDLNHEYILSGFVSRKVLSIRRQSINIKIEEVVKFDNARLFERFSVHYPAIVKKTNSNVNSSGLLVDISSGGILIASPTQFEPNTPLNIEIYFATDRPINFVGRILRRNQSKIGFHYGVVIEDIDNENALHFNKLIDNLLQEKKSLFDELKLFKRLNIAVYIIAVFVILFILSIFLRG